MTEEDKNSSSERFFAPFVAHLKGSKASTVARAKRAVDWLAYVMSDRLSGSHQNRSKILYKE